MAWAFVRETLSLSIASGSSGTLTIPAASSGNTIFLEMGTSLSTTAYVSALSCTNVTWDQMFRVTSTGGILQVYRGKVAGGASGTSISVTLNAALASTARFRETEFSGGDNTASATVDTSGHGTSASHTTGSLTPTASSSVLLYAASRAASGTDVVPASPWVALGDIGTNVEKAVYQIVTSASGSYSAAFTGGNVAYETGIFFIAASAAANTPPTAAITAPTANAHYATGASITFTGSGTDTEDGTLTGSSLQWTSSIDGSIGSGVTFNSSTLSVGSHTITLTATDSGSLTGTATKSITVGPAALLFTQAPTGAQVTGVAITPTVTVQRTSDGYTAINTSGITITLAIATGTGTVQNATANTNASGLATFTSFDIVGSGTFTITASDGASVCNSVTSGSFTVSSFTLITLATTPSNITVGGISGAVCPKYLRYVPTGYDGSVAYPVIMHWHGSTEEWNGGNPGNTGTQVDGAGASGLGDAVLGMLGQSNYAHDVSTSWTATNWTEGDWPAIIVFPQYGNSTKWTTGNTLQRAAWAESSKVLWDAIIADLVVAGYNIDTDRLYVSGVSGGAQVIFDIMLHDVLDNPTYHVAAALGGAAQIDVRGINQISGRTDSGTHVVNTTTVHYVASQLKNIPICVSAGQDEQENSILVDSNFDQASSTRDLANAFHNATDVGLPIPDNFWYIEYSAVGTSGTSHIPNYSWPFFTTEVKNWLFAQRRNRPTPVFVHSAAITLIAAPHMVADALDVVTYPIMLDATADTLSIKDVAHSGSMTNGGGAKDIAFYADSGRTRRLRAYRRQHNLTTGVAWYDVGVPRGSGINVGSTIYVGYGATVTDDLCADGRLAYDYRLRHVVDFGDGSTLTIANHSQSVFPDKVTITTAGNRDDFTLTGAPPAATSPIGGAVACAAASKYVTNHRPEWRTKTGDASNTRSVPTFAIAIVKPNGTVSADQCVVALQSSSSATRTVALIQGASNAAKLRHNTTVVTSGATMNASAFNFLAFSMTSIAQRSLYLNPADGNAATSDTTNITTLLSANQMQIGFCQASSIIENANATIAKLFIGRDTNTPNSTPGVPNADWFTAMDWAFRGKTVSYTVGAEQGTPLVVLAVTAHRFLAGTGATMCAVALPLRPGMLTPAQRTAGYGKLVLNGSEVATYLLPPTGPGAYNADGSMKCIYLQANPTLTKGSPITGQFQCDVLRSLSRAYTDPATYLSSPSATGPGGEAFEAYYVVPGAVVPTNASDLCDSGLFGHTRPRSENPVTAPASTYFVAFDTAWDACEPTLPAAWDGTNARAWYYDRLYSYLCAWARTGNVTYLQRGWAQYARIRYDNYTPNLFQVSEHDMALDGFSLAYWLFNDTAATNGANKFASNAMLPDGASFNEYIHQGDATSQSGGWERTAGNAIRAIVHQYLLGITSNYYSHTVTAANRLDALRKYMCDVLGPALATIPSVGDVANEVDNGVLTNSTRQQATLSGVPVLLTLPFQEGYSCHALQLWYDNLDPRPEILAMVKQLMDNCWAHLKVPGTGGRGTFFQFSSHTYDGPGSNAGGTGYAIDLNGFLIHSMYWLGWRLASQTYVDRGDELLDAHTRAPYNGTIGPSIGNTSQTYQKQWNEWSHLVTPALGTRALAIAAIANNPPPPPPPPASYVLDFYIRLRR